MMGNTHARALLEEGLQVLSPMLEADGYQLELKSVDEGQAVVILRATAAACSDCLVPDETLKAILLKEFQKRNPVIQDVELEKQGF